MNVAITAASGQLGSEIVKATVALLPSANVIGLARTPEYRKERVAELGEFIGTVITGIYQSIRDGEADNPSNYTEAAGREHVSWSAYFASPGRRGLQAEGSASMHSS